MKTFTRVLAQWEIQIASSRIWTRVTMSIFSDDNYYTMSASLGDIKYY